MRSSSSKVCSEHSLATAARVIVALNKAGREMRLMGGARLRLALQTHASAKACGSREVRVPILLLITLLVIFLENIKAFGAATKLV